MIEKNEISFIFCYARSGGTFLNRFLTNIKNMVILSEAHPIHNKKGGLYSIKNQALNWYGIEIKSEKYIDQIREIKRWCDINQKHLIIRDWSYIDFTKSHLNNFNPPYMSTNISLLENEFQINKIAFIRDAIDILLSQDISVNKFSYDYYRYSKYIQEQGIPYFKYEDFRDKPIDEYNKMADVLNSPKILEDQDFNIDNMFNSKKVVGDIDFSRAIKKKGIVKLDRKYAFFLKRRKINSDKYIQLSNRLFSYPENYESTPHESMNKYFKFKYEKAKKTFAKIKRLGNQ